MEKGTKLRCQRIGCEAMFTEDDNLDDSCRYHDAPIFHDGMKEWSCCKQRSHDFSLFLALPGCKVGKHTTEKPTTTAVKKPTLPPVASIAQTDLPMTDCSRCRQGFFCSDHVSRTAAPWQGVETNPVLCIENPTEYDASCLKYSFKNLSGSQPRTMNRQPLKPCVTPLEKSREDDACKVSCVPTKRIIDINAPQTCRNKGCGKTFKEKDNHAEACEYHPGPAVFHDRLRGVEML